MTTETEGTEQTNNDLVWGLDDISDQDKARDFIQRFENKLCVFSSSVEQIYTNYNIYFPKEQNHNMVILPNPYAFHDTFNKVPADAISDTGLDIVPGETIGRKGLHLLIRFKDQKMKAKPIPFKFGIKRILDNEKDSDPFIPVLIKGDLREFEASHPCIHLHRLKVKALIHLSSFEIDDIRTTIVDKLLGLAEEPN